jgi:hypothetical protein
MRMRVQRWWGLSLALFLLAAAGTAARAQEPPAPTPPPETPTAPPPESPPEDTPAPAPATGAAELDDRLGHWHLDLEQWIAQPSGLDYVATTIANPADPTGTLQMGAQHGTNDSLRVDVGFAFRDDIGRFNLLYWSHEDQTSFSQYDLGNFAFGENIAPLRFAGVFDDGTADAVDAHGTTTIRDLRLNFSRQAFTTPRVSARWSVGLRTVDHKRNFGATYHAILTGLPLVVSRPDLDPLPDTAAYISEFSGRGPDFGFDFDLPLGKRWKVAAGFSLAVLRGDLSTRYSALSRLYAVLPGATIEQVLGPDLPEYLAEWLTLPTQGENARPQILQLTMPTGVYNVSRSTSAQVLESGLSVRYRAWRGLEVFGGFRSTRYADVGTDLRPTLSEISVVGQTPGFAPGVPGQSVTVPVVGVVEANRSVDYEGFFLGLGYTY